MGERCGHLRMIEAASKQLAPPGQPLGCHGAGIANSVFPISPTPYSSFLQPSPYRRRGSVNAGGRTCSQSHSLNRAAP